MSVVRTIVGAWPIEVAAGHLRCESVFCKSFQVVFDASPVQVERGLKQFCSTFATER